MTSTGSEKEMEADEPKKRIEKHLDLTTLIIAYFFLYVYQTMISIRIEFIDFQTLTSFSIVTAIILPSIHYLIYKADPLQRSTSSRKPIRFFQNEFPSKYLLERCERCVENENSCPNYIDKKSFDHTRYWFNDIFHGTIENENPRNVRDTFERSYTCKFAYYLEWVLWLCLFLVIIVITFHFLHSYVDDSLTFDLTALQVLFPLACLGIILVLRFLHKPDENAPTGCWQAWREINGMHRSWLRHHEDFLVRLICQTGGGTKKFMVHDDNTEN